MCLQSSNAVALEQTLPGALQALKDALQQLVLTITTSIVPTSNTIDQNLKTSRDSITAALAAMNSTSTTMIQAYNQLYSKSLTSDSVSQSASQSVSQSVNQSVSQSSSLSVTQQQGASIP